jgi:uncharacterized protein (DUF433 family)
MGKSYPENDDFGNFGHTLWRGKPYLRFMKYIDYIEIVPEKRFGRPCLKGTRISVYDVLNWLANGMDKQDIIHDFPELTEEHIDACLLFAADREHKIRIAS